MSKEEDQRPMNERLVKNINNYWKERGVTANARVVQIEVPIYFEYVDEFHLNNKGDKVLWRVKKTLTRPKIVRSWEIISDIGGLVADWIEWSARQRRAA